MAWSISSVGNKYFVGTEVVDLVGSKLFSVVKSVRRVCGRTTRLISTLDCEYIVDRQTLKPVPSEETGEWLAKPTILAFDIETYSDRHNSFPQALSAKHAAFNISCIFQRAGDFKPDVGSFWFMVIQSN